MIAGLPKAPSAFNPLANSERSLIRRNWILFRMRELGHIDEDTYREAVQAPVTARRHSTEPEVDASYVAEMARQYAIDRFGDEAYTGGYRIYTTIDSELQPTARRALADGLIAYDRRHGWRGPEERDIAASLVEAQEETATQGLEEELAESPEIRQTARQAAERSQTEVEGIEGDVSNWVQVLDRTPRYGLLEPAIVVESSGQEMQVLVDGELRSIPWEGLSWARPISRHAAAAPSPARRVTLPHAVTWCVSWKTRKASCACHSVPIPKARWWPRTRVPAPSWRCRAALISTPASSTAPFRPSARQAPSSSRSSTWPPLKKAI